MIIWINGAFGSGKTQTAYELAKRLEKAYVFDPENAGYYMMKNLPSDLVKGDFQDYPLWREFNNQMILYMSKAYEGVLIIPMTINRKDYMEEIIGEVKTKGEEVKHFTLMARKENIEKRLKKRGDRKGTWAYLQIEKCLEGFSDRYFETYIGTDHMTIDEVVDYIANQCGLILKPDNRHAFKKKWDRLGVWFRHIRPFGL